MKLANSDVGFAPGIECVDGAMEVFTLVSNDIIVYSRQ
jgi:hypothetical protein